MNQLKCEVVYPGDARAAALIAELDADIMARYPGESTNGINPAEFRAIGGVFVLATIDGSDAGCGGFRPVALEGHVNTVEIKRMYVRPAFRGKGAAKFVLGELEGRAAAAGFGRAILETGLRQQEAIALYRRCGYEVIPNYGQFVGNAESICFGKGIRPGASGR